MSEPATGLLSLAEGTPHDAAIDKQLVYLKAMKPDHITEILHAWHLVKTWCKEEHP